MLKYILSAFLLFIAFMPPARADHDRHDRHDRHWRHEPPRRHYAPRPRTVVSFNVGRPYHQHARHYYHVAPRVVYVPTPQVVYIDDSNSRVVDSNNGRYCREYQTTSRIGGMARQTYGTACMQPDGSWEIQI